MTPTTYCLIAYALGLSLLWGYAASLYLSTRPRPDPTDDQLETGN